MTDYNFEQYKILTNSFNDEITRFWTRFNILMGIQMGGFVGVLASSKVLILNTDLFRLSLILMVLYSAAATIIVVRGHIMHDTIIKMLIMLEQNSDGQLKLLSLAGNATKIPIGLNQRAAIFVAAVFTITWVAFLIIAEGKEYAFILPK